MNSRLYSQRRFAAVLLTLAFGISLSVVAFTVVLGGENHRIKDDFEHNATAQAAAVKETIHAEVDVLHNIASLYKSSDSVGRDQFHAFVQHAFDEKPSIQALEWIPKVTAAERDTYEDAARRQGYPQFQFVELTAGGGLGPAGIRDEYFPVYFLDPFKGNEAALGFDLASNPVRLEALNLARDTGQPVATGRIILVQESEDLFGFLVFHPIYINGASTSTLVERRDNLAGFALGAFRTKDILEHATGGLTRQHGPLGLDVEVYDRSAPLEQQLLYATSPVNAAAGQAQPDLSFSQTFDVAGRTWELILTPSSTGLTVWSIWQAWAVLGGGLIITIMLLALVLESLRRTVLVERLVAMRTLELSQSNQQLEQEIAGRRSTQEALLRSEELNRSIIHTARDAFIAMNGQGVVVAWNPQAVATFGWSVPEAIGRHLADLIIPPRDREQHKRGLKRFLATGEGLILNRRLELTAMHRDGHEIPVEITISPLKLQDNHVFNAFVHDISARKRTIDALRQTIDQNRALLDAIPDMMFRISSDGEFLEVKDSKDITLFAPAQSILGKNVTDVLPADLSELCMASVKQALKTGEVQLFEYRLPFGESDCDFEVRVAPNGKSEALAIVRDITERMAVDRMKEEFVSMVSHELRTPLTSIRGSLGLIAGGVTGVLPEKAQHMVDIAVNNADRLIRLINDILDIERMESGRVAMEKSTCDARALVIQAAEIMRNMAEGAAVSLLVHSESTMILADPDRIVQTLTNLLSNAIKFSPRGSTISIGARLQGNQALLSVKDQGRGIPAEKLETIFDRFQQVDTSDSREKGGTGLGLAICRSIIQQHDGRIWAESTPGEGSAFFIEIPAEVEIPAEILELTADERRLSVSGESEPLVLV